MNIRWYKEDQDWGWRVSPEASSVSNSKLCITVLWAHCLRHLSFLFMVILANSYFSALVTSMSLCEPESEALVKSKQIEVITSTAFPFFMKPISLKGKKEIMLAWQFILDKFKPESLNHLIIWAFTNGFAICSNALVTFHFFQVFETFHGFHGHAYPAGRSVAWLVLCSHPELARPCGWPRMPLACVSELWYLVHATVYPAYKDGPFEKHCRNFLHQILALQHHWQVFWDWWQQILEVSYSSLPTSQVHECVWVYRQQQSDASLHPCPRAHPSPASEPRYSISLDAVNGLAHKHYPLLKIQDRYNPKASWNAC